MEIRTTLIIILTLFVTSLSSVAQTEEVPKAKNWSLSGYVKYMQTNAFINIDERWTTDNLVHNRLKFDWSINNKLSFTAHARNRIFYGETVSNWAGYSSLINQERGYMNLTANLFESSSVFMNGTFDRLYLDYNRENIQITIGRQRINWGQTFAWNPNDLFNAGSFFDFDYEEKPGSDAIRVQWYASYTSKVDLVAKMDYNHKLTAAALYRFNRWDADIQLLGGYFQATDYVLGGGYSGSLFKGGLRAEISYFHPIDHSADTSGTTVASLSYDYTFSNALMVQVGGLYNGYGQSSGYFNLSQFYTMRMSAQSLSLTTFSYMLNLSYPLLPLLNIRLSAMYNPNDQSFYIGPSADYSLKENLDLSIYSQFFISDMPQAFGGKGGFLFWRLKWSF